MSENSNQFDRRRFMKSVGGATALAAMAGCMADDDGDGLTDITALGGVTGGAGYQHCLAFQQTIEEEHDDIRVTVSGTDGWGWNATNMYETGNDEMGIVPAGDVYENTHRVGDYEEDGHYLAQVYPAYPPAYLHMVTLEEKDIEVYDDLEGQRINVLTRGTLTEELQPQVLDALGIEPEDYSYVPHEEARSALVEDEIDVAATAGFAAPYFELSQTHDVTVVTIEEGQQDQITDEIPWMGFGEPNFDDYGFEGVGEALVPAPWTVMAALVELDNDLVYRALEAVYNNIDHYGAVYDAADGLEPEMAVDANVPIHPGAVDYYEDQGIDIPDNIRIASEDDLPLED